MPAGPSTSGHKRVSYADAIAREVAWFRQTGVTGLTDLSTSFGLIAPWLKRRAAQQDHQLYVTCERARIRRFVGRGMRQRDHEMAAVVIWNQRQNDLGVEMETLDAALEKLVARIEDTPGTGTHGDRFSETGPEIEVEYPSLDVLATIIDQPGGQANSLVVPVRYRLTDYFPTT